MKLIEGLGGATLSAAAAMLFGLWGFASPAYAALQRTFVASNGVDTNPCSVALPCRSFAAAMAQTLPDGEIVVHDSAGYGPATIGQSVSIVAPPGIHAGITVASGNGITVNGTGIVVTLKGLTIIGQGTSNQHGIYVTGANVRVLAEDIAVTGMAAYGVAVANAAELVVRRARLFGNFAGAYADSGASLLLDDVEAAYSTYSGAYVHGGASMTVARSVVAANVSHGIIAADPGAPTQLSVDRTVVVDNAGAGVYVLSEGVGAETRASVARSTLARNGAAGLAAVSDQSAFAYATALGNVIEGQGGNGISAACYNAGHSVVNASANTAVRNSPTGFHAANIVPGNCVLRTIGNNMVRDSFGADLFNVTRVAGQ